MNVILCSPLEARIIEICMNLFASDIEEREELAQQVANEAGITPYELFTTVDEITNKPPLEGSDI